MMPDLVHDMCAGRLGRILLGLLAVHATAAIVLPAAHLILLLNGLALSVAAGVSTAFLPVAAHALRRPSPSRGDVLGAGIFFAGLSDVAQRVQSIVARYLAWPTIMNTDIAAISIFLAVISLVAFLWAPYADDGAIPRDKWVVAGSMVAAGVAIAFAAGLAHHSLTPSPSFRFQ